MLTSRGYGDYMCLDPQDRETHNYFHVVFGGPSTGPASQDERTRERDLGSILRSSVPDTCQTTREATQCTRTAGFRDCNVCRRLLMSSLAVVIMGVAINRHVRARPVRPVHTGWRSASSTRPSACTRCVPAPRPPIATAFDFNLPVIACSPAWSWSASSRPHHSGPRRRDSPGLHRHRGHGTPAHLRRLRRRREFQRSGRLDIAGKACFARIFTNTRLFHRVRDSY